MQHSPYGPSNLPDRQVATIEFENGTQATFTAVMAQPRTTRRIRVFGTEGLLEGDISAKSITLSFPDPAGGKGTSEEQIAVVSDRKSTRLNSSHVAISYAVFCLKKKNNAPHDPTNTPRKTRQNTL